MREVTFSIDIRACTGDNLDDCIHSAIYERRFSQFDLNLCFNEYKLLITRTSTFDSVMKSYNIYKEALHGIRSPN